MFPFLLLTLSRSHTQCIRSRLLLITYLPHTTRILPHLLLLITDLLRMTYKSLLLLLITYLPHTQCIRSRLLLISYLLRMEGI